MKRIGFTVALVAVLAMPSAAAAQRSEKRENPAKHCKKAERGESDASALRRAFGKDRDGRKRGKCVSERARLKHRLRDTLRREALEAAVSDCRAERAEDPVAFEQKYGRVEASEDPDERRGAHAFRRCVSQKLKAALAKLRESFDNAVEDCKAERAEDRDAFREKYGTNRNRRNALGKCVSRQVRADEEFEPGAGEDGKDRPGGTEDGEKPVEERPDAGEGTPERKESETEKGL